MPICKICLKTARPLPEAHPRQLVALGDHLRKERLNLGFIQKNIVRILQGNKDIIHNWENNHTSSALVHLPKIIDFLSYAPYFGPCRSLGEKIIMYRQFLGLSQKALAKQFGVDPCTVRCWEKNESEPKGVQYWNLSQFFLVCAKGSFS